MPTIEQTTERYKTFLSNPAVRSIASKPKWSISDKDKRPISLYNLLYNRIVVGGKPGVIGDTDTLDGLIKSFCRTFPDQGQIANFAFFLDAIDDDIVVLDIEPECPTSLKAEFAQLPYIYGEVSMSGRGMHLLFPKPKNFDDFPIAAKKKAMKGPKKYYEILMGHWVTFTGRALKRSVGRNIENQEPFEKLFATLAAQQTESAKIDIELDPERLRENVAEIPDADYIIDILTRPANAVGFKPERYDNDMSRYEFAYFGIKCSQLTSLLRSTRIKSNGHTYTPEDFIRLLYVIGTTELEHRDKHDSTRNGMPWLMYEAAQLVECRLSDDMNEKGH